LSNNLTKISNCSFTSRGTGHAIAINTPGTYDFDGNTFTNYASVTGNNGTEAIHNISNGVVNINVTNATSPSYRNSPGSTTNVTASVQVTLQGIKDNSEVRIYDAGTINEVAGIETATDGSPGNRTFAFSQEAGIDVDIVIHNTGYNYYRVDSYTIPSTTTSLPIDQKIDRVYTNPA